MPIAENHAERVAGLSSVAVHECDGDVVAAFAALCDAAVAIALAGDIPPAKARDRMAGTFRISFSAQEGK